MLRHQGSKTLKTDRLILRKFQESDAQTMFDNWASDDDVTRHMTWKTHESIDVTKEILALWLKDQESERFYHWGITLKENGLLIGSIGVLNGNDVSRKGSLGYCIGKPWWHQGIVPEAVSAVLDYMFDEIGIERIEAYHHIENPASGRVMQKCGMQHEGLGRKFAPDNTGKLVDCHLYAIIDTDRK